MPREMEKCTIKLNHWIVIASFRFILGIIALLIVDVLHKENSLFKRGGS
jgi:hypothetical protein